LLGKVEYDTTKHKAFMAELLNQTIVFFLTDYKNVALPRKENGYPNFYRVGPILLLPSHLL